MVAGTAAATTGEVLLLLLGAVANTGRASTVPASTGRASTDPASAGRASSPLPVPVAGRLGCAKLARTSKVCPGRVSAS
jgi:hypothetical protein